MPKKQKPTDKQSENNRVSPAEHLKPHWWEKGQSGNPKGRPRGKLPSDVMREMLESVYGNQSGEAANALEKIKDSMPEPWRSRKLTELTVVELISWMAIRGAMGNNNTGVNARRDLLDRVEGKPKMRIEGSGPGGSFPVAKFNLKRMSDKDIREWRRLVDEAIKAGLEEDEKK